MAQIANCFVCYEDVATKRISSKIIQIPKSVFQSNDHEYIESFIRQKFVYECEIPIGKLLLLNISVLGYYED